MALYNFASLECSNAPAIPSAIFAKVSSAILIGLPSVSALSLAITVYKAETLYSSWAKVRVERVWKLIWVI